MRDPAIHLKKSDLVKVLKSIEIKRGTTMEELADMILANSSQYQLRTRYLKILEQKSDVKKKVRKSVQADDGVPEQAVEVFNRLLTGIRQAQNPNVKVKPILKTSKEYILLKEVTQQAHDFVEQFNIKPIEEGYTEYIKSGIRKMKRYSLNRFKTYSASIFESFENRLEVLTEFDKDSVGLLEYLNYWKERMQEYMSEGMESLIEIDDNFDKMIHIVHGKRNADELEAPYDYWIDAQFDGLAFLDAIPELSQYYGENAQKRYEQFIQKSIELAENQEEESEIKKLYYKE